ncbi:homoserine kinase [Garicola koreensis]|uniref:Homoserine kinase n=1 Tax=Garicola koreensis TaxID=1262554 RepID=A0A7W5TSX5_9MICC|nr:homoserine kinase [Garicola koreensis]MBB3666779.1 homoserine kinase [Garicola koreensis]
MTAAQLGEGVAPEYAAGRPAAQLRAPLSVPHSFTLRVPATSANLGPGYDTLGLALELRDEIQVTASPRQQASAPRVGVVVVGEGAQSLPTDASHLLVTVTEKILAAKGYQLPDLQVRATNVIPHSRGLGSSAAAIAAAVTTADQLIPEGLSDDEKLQIGSRIEGHPDNYAPALRGSVAVSWSTGEPNELVFRTAPLVPHPQISTVVAVPDFVQSTRAARDVLPANVAHEQAARNSSRAALLVHALTTDPALLMEATEDFLHQEYRRSAFPASMALVDSLRAAGHPAVISGAGPAVLVLTDASHSDSVIAHIDESTSARAAGDTFVPWNLPITTSGVTVEIPR